MFSSSPSSDDYQHPLWLRSNLQRASLVNEILSALSLDSSSRVLDVGAGDLYFSKNLFSLGYDVVACEPRCPPRVKEEILFPVLDLDLQSIPVGQPYDLVLALGLLYHLENPLLAIHKLAQLCRQYLFIETIVLDHDGEAVVYIQESPSFCGNSLSGLACRPSPGWIVSTMAKVGFDHCVDLSSRLFDIPSDGVSTGLSYNWSFSRTCGWRRDEMQLRKMYLFSRVPVPSLANIHKLPLS